MDYKIYVIRNVNLQGNQKMDYNVWQFSYTVNCVPLWCARFCLVTACLTCFSVVSQRVVQLVRTEDWVESIQLPNLDLVILVQSGVFILELNFGEFDL